MANFTNNSIKDTYQRILQLSTEGIVENGTGSADLGNVHLSGSMYVTGSMVLSGDVTARSLTVNSLTQSTTIFSSGSTQFGDSLDDTHSFSGSVTVSGSISADTFVGMISGAAQIASEISGSFTSVSSSIAGQLLSINAATSSYVSHSASIIDIPGKKIQYSNVYTDTGDLPSATTYHGMFAHVHNEGAGYFAHAGAWVELANSASFATDIKALEDFSSSLDLTYATDDQVLTQTQSLSASLAADIATNLTNHTALDAEVTDLMSATGSQYAHINNLNVATSSFFNLGTLTGSVADTGKRNFFNKTQIVSSSLYPVHSEVRGHDLRFVSTSQSTTYGEIGFNSASAANSNKNLIEVIAYPGADELHLLNASGSTTVGIHITKTQIRHDAHTLISSSKLLTIEPSDPLPSSPSTGSLAVTGSILAFYNGNNWIELSGSILV